MDSEFRGKVPLLHIIVVNCYTIMADLSSELFTGASGDVVKFVRRLKIWALQVGMNDADVVAMVSLLMDGPALDWYKALEPADVKERLGTLATSIVDPIPKE